MNSRAAPPLTKLVNLNGILGGFGCLSLTVDVESSLLPSPPTRSIFSTAGYCCGSKFSNCSSLRFFFLELSTSLLSPHTYVFSFMSFIVDSR